MSALSDAIDELVALARHLRSHPERAYALVVANDPDLSNISRLEAVVSTIRYHATPVGEYKFSSPSGVHVQCSHPSCGTSSRDRDSCMLLIGSTWYCRAHHPPRESGSIRPVGWAAPTSADPLA